MNLNSATTRTPSLADQATPQSSQRAVNTFCIDGHTLASMAYNEDQSGTPIIFIHGIGSSVGFWAGAQPLTPVLAARRYYSLSLPGHYPAAFPRGFRAADLTPELIADLLIKAVRHLVGDMPVLLAGHSTGGFAALAMAACAPGLATAVVSVSGFAHGRWCGVLGLAQTFARGGLIGHLLFRANFSTQVLHPALYVLACSLLASDRRAYFKSPGLYEGTLPLYQAARRLDLNAMLCYFQRMPDIDITDWLGRIMVPVLAITGSVDHIVPPTESRRIAERAPQGALTVLQGSGHLPFAERPAPYAEAATPWYTRYSGLDGRL